MLSLKHSLDKIFVIGLLATGLLMPTAGKLQAQSLSESIYNQLPTEWGFDPPERGKPEGREGGATRGPCIKNNQKLQVLGPNQGAITASGFPSFFWYMPETNSDDVVEVEFLLEDELGNEVYKTQYQIGAADGVSENPNGIMRLDLPSLAEASPLTMAKRYRWEVSLSCGEGFHKQTLQWDRSYIYRDPQKQNIAELIEQENSLEQRIVRYAEAGLWPETLASLHEALLQEPNDPDLKQSWTKLLNSVGLKDISEHEFVSDTATHSELVPFSE
ncbi:MAG: DUF928 domain-containing protein [Oscillatoria sp. PMC 1068.18]|nr:DUF928 domain-containing protein [Oscillatoria sp. PMC 1076.18]MEC4990668.1 DUF928 domain-containing protein [Oscillatoria sp. PMC 1068.18]